MEKEVSTSFCPAPFPFRNLRRSGILLRTGGNKRNRRTNCGAVAAGVVICFFGRGVMIKLPWGWITLVGFTTGYATKFLSNARCLRLVFWAFG